MVAAGGERFSTVSLLILFAGAALASWGSSLVQLFPVILLVSLTIIGVVLYFPSALVWSVLVRSSAPVFLIFLCGILYIYNNNSYEIFKDAFYLWKLPMCALLGLIIGRGFNHDRLMSFYINCCFVFGILFLTRYALVGADDTDEFARIHDSGGAPLFTCLALGLLIRTSADKRPSLRIPVNFLVVITVLLVMTALSMSRTYIVCTAIGVFVFADLKYKIVALALGGALALALILQLASTIDPQQSYFLFKFVNSFQEIAFVGGYDKSDVITNWRGFEATMAWDQFLSVSLGQQLFGQGLGANVNLGDVYYLNPDAIFSEVPILHNGYFHILTKYGVIGIVMYFLFLYNLFGPALFSRGREGLLRRKTTFSFVIIVIFTTGVVTGLFNKSLLDSLFVFVVAVVASRDSGGGISHQMVPTGRVRPLAGVRQRGTLPRRRA